jgi:hypothetical protein
MVPVDDGASPAPIDRSVLERMRSRFAGSRMFESVEMHNEGNLHLRVELSSEYYPNEVSARFEVRWYRNDDLDILPALNSRRRIKSRSEEIRTSR